MATVAQFEISHTRVLDEGGELVGELPEFAKDAATLERPLPPQMPFSDARGVVTVLLEHGRQREAVGFN